MKREQKELLILSIIGLILLSTIGIGTYNAIINRKEIKNNYDITEGRIIDYFEVGVEENESVIYEYEANGIKYQRETSSPRKFKNCKEGSTFFYLCKEYRFWVIYKKDEHSRSLINLHQRIDRLADPIFPKDKLHLFR